MIAPCVPGHSSGGDVEVWYRSAVIAPGPGHNGAGVVQYSAGIGRTLRIAVGELHFASQAGSLAAREDRPSRFQDGSGRDSHRFQASVSANGHERFLERRGDDGCVGTMGHVISVPVQRAGATAIVAGSSGLVSEVGDHARRMKTLERGVVLQVDHYRVDRP